VLLQQRRRATVPVQDRALRFACFEATSLLDLMRKVRVHGGPMVPGGDLPQERDMLLAFLTVSPQESYRLVDDAGDDLFDARDAGAQPVRSWFVHPEPTR
jgi:hypothetical protein